MVAEDHINCVEFLLFLCDEEELSDPETLGSESDSSDEDVSFLNDTYLLGMFVCELKYLFLRKYINRK